MSPTMAKTSLGVALLTAGCAAVSVAIPACSAPDPGVSYLWADHTSAGGANDAGVAPSAVDAAAAAAAADAEVAPATVDAAFDGEAVLAVIRGEQYQTSSSFVECSVPYPSVAAVGSLITEWVSVDAVPAYEAIVPDGGAAGVVLPVGSILVRAILNDAGAVSKLTLMAKGPAGYNPALGDWWFGETDPSGVPEIVDGGAMIGRLTGCYSCHIPQSGNDFVFGVPTEDRSGTL